MVTNQSAGRPKDDLGGLGRVDAASTTWIVRRGVAATRFGYRTGDGTRDAWPAAVVDAVVAGGPDTYQKRQSHRLQVRALMARVAALGPRAVVDLGAGKALLSRCCYEAFERKVPTPASETRQEQVAAAPRPRRG